MNSIFYRLLPKLRQLCETILACILTKDGWQSLTKCDILLVCHDNDRGYTYRNQAYSQLLDSLGDLFRKRGIVTQTIATPFSRMIGCKAYGQPLAFNRESLSIILKKQFRKFICSNKDWAETQQEILWRKILKYSQPKVVIGIQPVADLCRAGHVEEILVYDLQHGVITDENPWYGKEFRDRTDPQDLPHGFLCWDKSSSNTLEQWTNQKGITVQIVGNPWFRRFLLPDADDLLVQEALAIKPLLDNDRPIILVSLQWGMVEYFGEYVANGVMPEALEQTILKTAKLYNWLIRLHPVQIRGAESSMVHHYLTKTFGHLDTVEWQQCSEVPLPVVLKWSNIHITYNSTITTEAAWMGLNTGLLDPEICPGGKSSTYYSYERSLGIAETLPLDPFAIEAWIESILNKDSAEPLLIENESGLEEFISKVVGYCQK